MISTRVSFPNVRRALQALEAVGKAFDAGAEESTKTLRTLAQGGTPVLTGRAKRSWGQVARHTGGFSFTNPLDYTVVLEEGTYPTVGPRTMAFEGGIFSRQAPGGILTPLVEDDDVLRRIADLIAEMIERDVNRAGT